MDEHRDATRRTFLKAAGVTVGAAALGTVTYAASRATASTGPTIEWTTDVDAEVITRGVDGGFGLASRDSTVTKLGGDGDDSTGEETDTETRTERGTETKSDTEKGTYPPGGSTEEGDCKL